MVPRHGVTMIKETFNLRKKEKKKKVMILIFYCSQYLATSTCVWFMLKYTVYVKDLCGNFQKFYDVDTLHPFNLMPTIFLSLILIIK